MTAVPAQRVTMIAVDQITVINPRVRNRRVFKQIVDNIGQIGLKRPITVTKQSSGTGYDLVCGQGRLEACRTLGYAEIPALIVDADEEDCLIASLVENCARRHPGSRDLLQDIAGMQARGHSRAEIAAMTGLSPEYLNDVSRLLERGEDRLLNAVEAGIIPLNVAVNIADADDLGVQAALQQAYEDGLLRGRRLIMARRIVERRKHSGRSLQGSKPTNRRRISSEAVVKAFEKETRRKRSLIRRSEVAKARLTFIVEALRVLTDDHIFVALVEETKITTMPANLAARLEKAEVRAL